MKRVIKSNSKVHLKALNLMKLVASYHACAKDIVNSMTLLLTYCTVPVGRRNTGQVKVTLQIITKSIKTSKKLSTRTAPNISTVVGLIESWHKYDKAGIQIQALRLALVLLRSEWLKKQSASN